MSENYYLIISRILNLSHNYTIPSRITEGQEAGYSAALIAQDIVSILHWLPLLSLLLL